MASEYDAILKAIQEAKAREQAPPPELQQFPYASYEEPPTRHPLPTLPVFAPPKTPPTAQ